MLELSYHKGASDGYRGDEIVDGAGGRGDGGEVAGRYAGRGGVEMGMCPMLDGGKRRDRWRGGNV